MLYFLHSKPQHSLYNVCVYASTMGLTTCWYSFYSFKSAILVLKSHFVETTVSKLYDQVVRPYVVELGKCMVCGKWIFALNFVGVRAHFQFTMGVKISIEFGLANCSRNHKVQFYIHTWAFYMVQLRESMQHIWKWKYMNVCNCTRTRPWSSRI